MDLMRLLRSLEEFLYELVGWLVFFPRTLWRIFWHPGEIARYTRAELALESDQKFTDTITPVLMLILSVAVAHAMELAAQLPLPSVDSPAGRLAFGSEEALLITRSVAFCIYALGAALGTLYRERLPITRNTLRGPFSIQAFIACPFVVFLSAGNLLARGDWRWGGAVGAIVEAGSCVWYIGARTAAFRALHGGGWLKPLVSVFVWFFATTLAIVAVLLLMQ